MRRAAGFLIAIAVIDQAVHFFVGKSSGIWLLPGGNALIRPVWNAGGIFSWPIPLWVLISGSFCVGMLLLWMLWKRRARHHQLFQWSMLVLLYGGAANLVDRILHGAVLDYIDLPGPFPIFNIPDVLVFCGAIGIVWDMWRTRRIDNRS